MEEVETLLRPFFDSFLGTSCIIVAGLCLAALGSATSLVALDDRAAARRKVMRGCKDLGGDSAVK